MDYENLRQLADSWGLVYLVTIFIGVIFFVFRPGSKRKYKKNSEIPLRED